MKSLLGQNLRLTKALPTDLSYSGDTTTVTVDTNAVGIGAALVMASDGNFDEADADSATTMPCTALALETGVGSKLVLLSGYVRNDTWSWTVGGILYVSTTQGTMTQTAPSGTGDQIQPVGIAVASNIVYFFPSLSVAEHV